MHVPDEVAPNTLDIKPMPHETHVEEEIAANTVEYVPWPH